MSAEIVDLHARRPAPTLRRTQQDAEALTKLANVLAMVDAGYITPDAAMPWLRLELRRVGLSSETAS